MAADTQSVTVYSDYVCPFCYLGHRSLEEYLARREEPLVVDWHPFDLRAQKRGPDGEVDHDVDDGKDDAYFEEVRETVRQLKDRYDADEMVHLDDLPEHVDSFDAQAASLYVKEEQPEAWPAFDEAIFEVLWIDGRDIGDVDVLVDLAADVGLDEAEIRAALEDDTLRDRLFDHFRAAQQRGITAVPTFAYGEHAARGAVPPEQFERLVDGE
jgi:predicted DsbA family dithiol-disulfide isomerase